MKRPALIRFALTIIITITALQLSAQKLYVSAGGGYGLSIIKNTTNINKTIVHSSIIYSTWDGISTVESNNVHWINEVKLFKGTGSYGKGFQTGVTVGYMINDYLGAEVNICYLFGSEIQESRTTTFRRSGIIYTDLVNPANNITDFTSFSDLTDNKSKASMLRIIPGMRITFPDWKVKPYLKVGLVIGVACKLGKNTVYSISNEPADTSAVEETYKYTGGTSLGFAGGLGASMEVIKNLTVFAEAGVILQNWCPQKSVMTKYIDGGVDKLDQLTVAAKETEYVESYTTDYSVPIDNTVPTKATKVSFPFSTVGFTVGLTYSFGLK
jgi:opacity protein-like surface antigen